MTDLADPIYTNADAAREHLETLLWPNGPICPHCGGFEKIKKLEGKSTRPGVYKCGEKDCRKPFTVTVGTVFERSKIPLNKWVLAAHLMGASKKGISAHQMSRMLGFDKTYKTAWFMMMRLREAAKPIMKRPFGDEGQPVEVDETFWGRRKGVKMKGGGTSHKMSVLSLVERAGDKKSMTIPNVTAKTLRAAIKANLSTNARLMTDERKGYMKVGKEFAEHGIVTHRAGEYARGDVTTNTVESSFALLKRGLVGTFHHVSEGHLQRYADEFDFRWNLRKTDDDQRAAALLGAIQGKRLMYRQPESRE